MIAVARQIDHDARAQVKAGLKCWVFTQPNEVLNGGPDQAKTHAEILPTANREVLHKRADEQRAARMKECESIDRPWIGTTTRLRVINYAINYAQGGGVA